MLTCRGLVLGAFNHPWQVKFCLPSTAITTCAGNPLKKCPPSMLRLSSQYTPMAYMDKLVKIHGSTSGCRSEHWDVWFDVHLFWGDAILSSLRLLLPELPSSLKSALFDGLYFSQISFLIQFIACLYKFLHQQKQGRKKWPKTMTV